MGGRRIPPRLKHTCKRTCYPSMKIQFIKKRFNKHSKPVIAHAIRICEDFQARGYSLTLRQIYYQFIGHDLFPDAWIKNGTKNHQSNYDKLGSILSDARRAGLVDWDFMVDRTRNTLGRTHWDDLSEMMRAYVGRYTVDYWQNQPNVPELWVEKDALIDVFSRVTIPYDTRRFSTRGYPSDSALFEASRRIQRTAKTGRKTVILHFADHDPSGLDMTRAIGETLELFGCDSKMLRIKRVGLNMNQTKGLPANFAKATDSRTVGYVEKFKTSDCWELDAIDPDKLNAWAEKEIKKLIKDPNAWEARKGVEKSGQAALLGLADNSPETLLNLFEERGDLLETLQSDLDERTDQRDELSESLDDLKKEFAKYKKVMNPRNKKK